MSTLQVLAKAIASLTQRMRQVEVREYPAGPNDPDAIHDNVAAEIAGIAPKVAPIAADLIVIEDSAAANAKKSVQIGNLPGGGAPIDAEYVVTAANGVLTAEVVRSHFKYAPYTPGYDEPPIVPDAMDDEFTSGALLGIWAWIQTAPTYVENDPVGWGKVTACAVNEVIGLVQAIPVGDFDIRAKISIGFDAPIGIAGGRHYFGLGIFDGVGNNDDCEFIAFRTNPSATVPSLGVRYNWVTTLDPPTYAATIPTTANWPNSIYFRIKLDTATYYWYFSIDGVSWILMYSGAEHLAGAPVYIGFVFIDFLGSQLVARLDWFRRFS